jgi:hypothetical protein
MGKFSTAAMDLTMNQQLAVGRIIGFVIAVVGFGAAIWCAMASARLNAEFHQWERDRPMETAIDLSRPGQVTVPFRQTCGISHGEAICLECEIDRDPDERFQEAFTGLAAKFVIRDADGREIESRTIDVDSVHAWRDQIVLTGLAPFARGDYLATIEIESGAAALAGRPQVVYAVYQLCGMEQVPAIIWGAFGVVAGVTGLIAGACVLPGLLRHGIRRVGPSKEE